MFESLLRRSSPPRPAGCRAPDERLALAALLVRVARADGHYAGAEVSRIDAVLRARFGLGPFDAGRPCAGEAETLEEEAPDTVRFTRALKDAVPYEERLGVIEALWEVALADGRRDAGRGRADAARGADARAWRTPTARLARQRVEARLDVRRAADVRPAREPRPPTTRSGR